MCLNVVHKGSIAVDGTSVHGNIWPHSFWRAEVFICYSRQQVCEQFYALGSWVRQMDFICHSVTSVSVKQRRHGSSQTQRKHQSIRYTLMLDNTPQRVCKSFFCNTLSISAKRVVRALAEKSASGIFAGSDKRIGKAPINNVTEDRLDTVRVPRIEPHYCRANTTMQYLSPELSISKLYDVC